MSIDTEALREFLTPSLAEVVILFGFLWMVSAISRLEKVLRGLGQPLPKDPVSTDLVNDEHNTNADCEKD